MREEMHQEMKMPKEDMEAHMDKTLSKMVSENNVNVHGKNQLVTPQKTTRFQQNPTNIVTPRQKKHRAMQLSGDSSHQNNILPAVSPKQQYESLCIGGA
eukprot:6029769-Ditylum_brightwellii.AAC.1